jgi:predicted ArsR family transcriptional regulator
MPDRETGLAALTALAEPLRRRLYLYVAAQAIPVSRDAAAAALDVPRSVAAFHLDKLADAGLLEVEYHRPPGRGGPGAGRPAKWYRRAAAEIAVSVPERQYDVAASLLTQALAEAGEDLAPARLALGGIARSYGRAISAELKWPAGGSRRQRLAGLAALLANHGYEPRVAGSEITLGNCPFHKIAELQPGLVCSMNVDLIDGVLEGLGEPGISARLDPMPGRCCVTILAS